MTGRRFSAIDLFAGCGGAAMGYRSVGFDIKFAYDHMPEAILTYNHNNKRCGTLCKHLDMSLGGAAREIADDLETLGPDFELDAILASPPCTDFSSVGLRQEGDAAILTVRCADIILVIAPRFFIIENVPEFLASGTFTNTKALLIEKYDLVSVKINAARVRVPQSRVRTFLVGIRTDINGHGRLPLEKIVEMAEKSQERQMMSFGEAFPSFGSRCYYISPRNQFKRGIFGLNTPCPSLRTCCTNRLNPLVYKRRQTDAGHPDDAVNLSIRQLCGVMSFPPYFSFPDEISRTKCGIMIGNAVPTNLAAYIGKCVISTILWLETMPKRYGVYLAGIASSTEQFRNNQAHARVRRIVRFARSTDMDKIRDECKNLGSNLTRVAGTNRLQMEYEIGTTDEGDDRIASILKYVFPKGWVIRIKDRPDLGVGGGAPDDVYLYESFGGKVFRSIANVKKYVQTSEFQNKKKRKVVEFEPLNETGKVTFYDSQ